MRTFTTEKSITSVKRQVYTGAKSTLTEVHTGFTGYLRPLSDDLAAANGLQFGQGYQLITEVGVDIQTGDRITIDAQDYTVRGKAVHDRGRGTAYTRFLMVKPEK